MLHLWFCYSNVAWWCYKYVTLWILYSNRYSNHSHDINLVSYFLKSKRLKRTLWRDWPLEPPHILQTHERGDPLSSGKKLESHKGCDKPAIDGKTINVFYATTLASASTGKRPTKSFTPPWQVRTWQQTTQNIPPFKGPNLKYSGAHLDTFDKRPIVCCRPQRFKFQQVNKPVA